MRGDLFGIHVDRYPAIATVLTVAANTNEVSRRVRKATESLTFKFMTPDELASQYYYRSVDRRWNDECPSEYPVVEIRTTEHYVAAALKSGDVFFFENFEGENGIDETCENSDDDVSLRLPTELGRLLADFTSVQNVVVVTKTTTRNVEAMDFGDELTPGKIWADEVRYEVEVLLLQRH